MVLNFQYFVLINQQGFHCLHADIALLGPRVDLQIESGKESVKLNVTRETQDSWHFALLMI